MQGCVNDLHFDLDFVAIKCASSVTQKMFIARKYLVYIGSAEYRYGVRSMALLGTEYTSRYRFYKYQQVKNVAIFGVSQDCKFLGQAGGLCSELNYTTYKYLMTNQTASTTRQLGLVRSQVGVMCPAVDIPGNYSKTQA
jgi:hypothetical protein